MGTHVRKTFLSIAVAAAAIVAVAGPARAITRGGVVDDNDHPYVGLMAAVDANGERMWRCSGTLISPTIFVTAGHCVSNSDNSPIAHALVWTVSDLEPDPGTYGYGDQYTIVDGVIQNLGDAKQGAAYPHPDYVDRAFFLWDLGVVVLDGDGFLDEVTEFASVPAGPVEFGHGRNKAGSTVTAVGYGLQEIVSGPEGVGPDSPEDPFDPKLTAEKTRYQADLMVVDTKGVGGLGSYEALYPGSGSFIVSGDAKHGGTCFGDSGGPMLLEIDGEDVVVGVNSFGLNGNCAGIGGVYRIDQPDDLKFIACVSESDDPSGKCYE